MDKRIDQLVAEIANNRKKRKVSRKILYEKKASELVILILQLFNETSKVQDLELVNIIGLSKCPIPQGAHIRCST